MKRFESIEHTADVGIRAFGKDLPELFSNAALGMFDTLVEIKEFASEFQQEISLEAQNLEELLISWLRELLYKYIFDKLIVVQANVTMKGCALRAKVFCARLKNNTNIKEDIKAVTYHNVKIEKISNIYQADIIFDV